MIGMMNVSSNMIEIMHVSSNMIGIMHVSSEHDRNDASVIKHDWR